MGDGKNILRICNVIALLFFVDYIDLSEWNSQENMGCCSFDFMCSFPIMMLFDFSIHRYGDLDYSNLEYLEA